MCQRSVLTYSVQMNALLAEGLSGAGCSVLILALLLLLLLPNSGPTGELRWGGPGPPQPASNAKRFLVLRAQGAGTYAGTACRHAGRARALTSSSACFSAAKALSASKPMGPMPPPCIACKQGKGAQAQAQAGPWVSTSAGLHGWRCRGSGRALAQRCAAGGARICEGAGGGGAAPASAAASSPHR
jgi:hypothetical protein